MKQFLSLFIVFAFCLHVTGQNYVGSNACKTCHSGKYNSWEESGHNYKFNVISNDQAPVYPDFVLNYKSDWLANLGDGSHTWSDISGVIGGYGWKVRFVGKDGHIIGTAGSSHADAGLGHNQFNFYGGENIGWSNYETEATKKYNYSCFKCHTTGGDTSGTWLSGVAGLGTFTEAGVGCEACHGPGGDHVQGPSANNIDRVYEYAHLDNTLGGLQKDGVVITPNPSGNSVNFLCGTCHNRSYTDAINSKGGFIQHHEQWDELMATQHGDNGLTCITCHDPHKESVWSGQGITKTCETCHSDKAAQINHPGTKECIDCHMPYATKSGATRGSSGYQGDVRTHLFAITVDSASMFTADGKAVKDDGERKASLSPHFSCLGCHNSAPDDAIPDKTIAEAVTGAKNMHSTTAIDSYENQLVSVKVFPNPASVNGGVNIYFNLNTAQSVSINIYDARGRMVYGNGVTIGSGNHKISWNTTNNAGEKVEAGVYYINIKAGGYHTTEMILLMK